VIRLMVGMMLSTAVLLGQGSDQSDREHTRIVALENAWNEAVALKDSAALDMLLAPELVYVEYDGSLMDKAQYLAAVRSPVVRPARIVSESVIVHFYSNIAVVSGVYRETGIKDGNTYALRERFTDTWIHRSGSWMCVASQSTLISH
jgi:ketosteroid isomerase-like protein